MEKGQRLLCVHRSKYNKNVYRIKIFQFSLMIFYNFSVKKTSFVLPFADLIKIVCLPPKSVLELPFFFLCLIHLSDFFVCLTISCIINHLLNVSLHSCFLVRISAKCNYIDTCLASWDALIRRIKY